MSGLQADNAAASPISQLSDSELRAAKARAAREVRRAAGLFVLMEPFAKIEAKAIRWLWPNRIPAGKLTILAGDPGVGKSLLTLDLAARVSRGYVMPDGEQPEAGDVILLSAEDDAADTIRPRLEIAGAALDRIRFLRSVCRHGNDGGAKSQEFKLADVEALADAVDTIEEEGRTVRLVVIDPISAFLGDIDGNSNGDVRGVLRPVADLAARRGVAIVGVSHLRKGLSPVAIYRVTGSLAFTAAARAVYAIVRDPAEKARRLLLPVKCNLSPDSSGLAYRVESVEGVPYLHWEEGRVEQAADALLGEPGGEHHSELEEAADFLRDVLADGPIPAVELQRLAREAGISMRTINRAKRIAGASSRRQGKIWVWALQDCQECQDVHSGNLGNLGAPDGT